ncbi:hypothetical protein HTY54_27455 [Escherichia coli]|nr:hypothetical protein [Escherichia coli]
MWLVHLSPRTTETGCGRVCTPRKVRLRENRAAVRRQTGQRQLRHQAQWPYTPSGVQGSAASGATEEKRRHNNGMWWSLAHHSRTGENRENRTTFTTKKKVKFLHFFHSYLSR